jgi:thiosulfate/3-mercaptopyruvate sulfurtransferase
MNSTIISAASLLAMLPENPVILDCRFSLQDPASGEQQYLQGHIPGAHYCSLDLDLSGPKQQHGGRHPLPDKQALASTFAHWGINRFSQVVVYDDSRMGFAARAWWLLRAMGVQDVTLLNGGYQAWVNAGNPVDKRIPPTRTSQLKAPIAWPDIAHLDMVKEASLSGNATLVDSRESNRYLGLEEPIDPVAGHIPGAINNPWQDITDSEGFIQPDEFHYQRWSELDGSAPLIVYCGSGVTACVNLLSLHLAGRDEALLYPGSWSDWCSYSDADIATGPLPTPKDPTLSALL